jgi:hypothetical protein
MAPVDDDSTRDPRDPKTVNVVLEAVPLAAGAPQLGAPTLTQVHNLTALPLLAGSSGPKKPAPPEMILGALRSVYSGFADGEGPNINDVIDPVKQFLAAFGLEATKNRIQEIVDKPEFKLKRRRLGLRRT